MSDTEVKKPVEEQEPAADAPSDDEQVDKEAAEEQVDAPADEKPADEPAAEEGGEDGDDAPEEAAPAAGAGGEAPAAAGGAGGAGAQVGSMEDDALGDAVASWGSVAGRGYMMAYGWMRKQGEGGLFKRANWKRRFFILYRVPQGAVLVYYQSDAAKADDILGFVDLRNATDARVGQTQVDGEDRKVVEVVTPKRTFYLLPETVCQEETLALPADADIFILGWPVREPVISRQWVAPSAAAAFEKRAVIGRPHPASPSAEAPTDREAYVYDRWHRQMLLSIKSEQMTLCDTVEVSADRTGLLPKRLTLRASPSDLVLLDADEPDRVLACWAYRDVSNWTTPTDTELSLTVRGTADLIKCTFRSQHAQKIKDSIEQHVSRLVSLRDADGGEEEGQAANEEPEKKPKGRRGRGVLGRRGRGRRRGGR